MSEAHELECLRAQVSQAGYPCSPHCAGYLRELSIMNRLDGLREFLIDHGAAKRIEAEGLIGGYRNRTIAEAEDCERWVSALTPPDAL